MTTKRTHLALLALALAFVPLARGDESRTGDGRVVENPTSNGDLKLRVNVGGTKQDALTILGASGRPTWKTPAANGMIFNLDTTTAPSSAAAQNTLQFLQAGSIKAYLGAAGLGNGLINGDLASDFSIVATANAIGFSTDNGSTKALKIDTTNAMTQSLNQNASIGITQSNANTGSSAITALTQNSDTITTVLSTPASAVGSVTFLTTNNPNGFDIRASNASGGIRFDAGGSSSMGSVSSAGRWVFGPSGRQSAVSVGQGQAAALFGNPSSQNFTLANSGSTTIAVSAASNGTALCMIENGNSAASALLFMGGAGNTLSIISQTGAVFVTGAPSSSQTQVTFTSSGSTLNVTDGSANGTSHFVTCMGTFI